MGDAEAWSLGCVESTVKYHPFYIKYLTVSVNPIIGQCQVGGLTGAVASQRVTEVREGCLALVGNQRTSVKAQGSLTARRTCRAGAKAGLSDLAVVCGSAVT